MQTATRHVSVRVNVIKLAGCAITNRRRLRYFKWPNVS